MTPILFPGVYELIYEMSNIADPTNKWRNTFTISATTPPTASSPVNDALGTLLLHMAHTEDQVDKVTAYNWARGAQPYPNGTPIYIKTYGNPGLAETTWYPPLLGTYSTLGKEVCARIDHVAVSGGKPGRNFVRRFFGDADVAGSESGPWFIGSGVAPFQTKLNAEVISLGIDAFLDSGSSSTKLVVVRFSKRPGAPAPSKTNVSTLAFIGVTTNRITRKNKK